MRVVGLMSGTSLDGIDAALLRVEGTDPDALEWRMEAFHTRAYTPEERARVQGAIEGGGAAELCHLHGILGEWFAAATLELLREAGVAPDGVAAIGSHGQTVWHIPPEGGERGFTLQLGDPATLAERTGIPVVSDLRARDLAAGGHGAPLVPWADRVLLSRPGRARVLQNLGGMGNLAWIPPRGSPEATVAFDTGPGVVLLDAAAREATAGEWSFDRDGTLAAAGRVDGVLLDRLLADPFFRLPPPRSTGREHFSPALVRELAKERGLRPGHPQEGWPDLLATLAALTARSIGDACARWVTPRPVDEVVLAGGAPGTPSWSLASGTRCTPSPSSPGPTPWGSTPMPRRPPPSPSWRGRTSRGSRGTSRGPPAPGGPGCWGR